MVSVAIRRHVPATRKCLVFHFQCEDDMTNGRDIVIVVDMSFEITLRVGVEGLPVQM